MKKVKNLFVLVLVISNALMFSGCYDNNGFEDSQRQVVFAGNDTTITLPVSSVILSGRVDLNPNGPWKLVSSEWKYYGYDLGMTIENPSSLQTKVTGLTGAGDYTFSLYCRFRNGVRFETKLDQVTVTVLPATSTPNTFTISPTVYSVQSIKKIENYVSALSFRNGADSGSVTFFFLNNGAIPASGSTMDFKVVPIVRNPDEVRVSAVRTTGNSTIYDCIGTDNVKASVSVNANGKVSIKMPDALAKRLRVADTIKVSADINEQ